VKTEKSFNTPYDNPALVKIYEGRYIHHHSQQDDIKHEIKVIESIMTNNNYTSWCDVACGTAYHLRKAEGSFARYGVDRSSTMINQHRHDTVYHIDYGIKNFLTWQSKQRFDLVTNFWFGYAHQPTLDKVLQFFDRLVEYTETGGSLLVSLHNQWKIFDKYPYVFDEPMGGKFLFDAMHWSYHEPETGDLYECIVPHKNLIVKRLLPYFTSYVYLDYPVYAGKELLYLQGKHDGT
jgi:SAM-dependent methyltransferase